MFKITNGIAAMVLLACSLVHARPVTYETPEGVPVLDINAVKIIGSLSVVFRSTLTTTRVITPMTQPNL